MSTATRTETTVTDPWRYGWRYVHQQGPDGKDMVVQVPLKKEDLLHPHEDDFIVQTFRHNNLCQYLREVINALNTDRSGFVVMNHCRIDWEVEGIKPHGPDIAAFAKVRNFDPNAGTFRVAQAGAEPLAVIEVTSPETRENDFGPKFAHYHKIAVPVYVIIDLHPATGESSPQIYGYLWTVEGYRPLPLDDRGRLRIENLGLWIGVEDGEVVCYGPDGQRLAEYPEIFEAAKDALAQAAAAAEATHMEAAARAAAEARVRELEAEIDRLRKAKSDGKNGA